MDAAYAQAVGYLPRLKERQLPRYIIVRDFASFRVRNLEAAKDARFPLEGLEGRQFVATDDFPDGGPSELAVRP